MATIYYFSSPTCSPCATIKPAIADLMEEFDDVTWVSVNTHVDKEGFAKKYGVTVVPTIVATKNGMEVGRHSGTNMITYYTVVRKARSA